MSAVNRYFRNRNKKPTPIPFPIPTPNEPITNPEIPVGEPDIRENNMRKLTTENHQGLRPIGMSYWRNINNHVGRNELLVFLSLNDEIVIFTVQKSDLLVLGEQRSAIHHTGEGCYFSALEWDKLYVPRDNRLNQVSVIYPSDYIPVCELPNGWNGWQWHSSQNERVHSCTIKDANWNIIKWGVFNQDKNDSFRDFDIEGAPDECQIDKSGRFLVIKEDNYNRIIDLETDEVKYIQNDEGALGHSDNGFEYIIGENDYSPLAGALDYINLRTLRRGNLFSTGIWNMGYVSHCNAINAPIESQSFLISTPKELISVKANGQSRIVANIEPEVSDYEQRVKANLDITGEYAAFTQFKDGRLDAYLIRVPLW